MQKRMQTRQNGKVRGKMCQHLETTPSKALMAFTWSRTGRRLAKKSVPVGLLKTLLPERTPA